jgi:hypothetical protein
MFTTPGQRYPGFLLSVLGLCFLYLFFEIFYTYYATLSVDEFWFAHRIYEYKSGIPYRDFSPYKTVLGYYLLLPPMTLIHGFLTPLLATKNYIAVMNIAIMTSTAFWLKKFFSKNAILTTLCLLLFSEFVLSYSTNIRVDLLAYWFCLISVLLLLEKKFLWSGFILALGFLTSQKVLWYIVASDCALVIYWLCAERNWKNYKNIILFNLIIVITTAFYISFWSYFAGLKTVLQSIFYEAYVMYQLDWYAAARKLFWSVTLTHNPLPFMLWPATLLSLFVIPEHDHGHAKRIFAISFGSIILLCLIPYKQIFPYYMLTALPAFIILYSAFFSWLYALLHSRNITILAIGKTGIWGLICVYFIALSELYTLLPLPVIYFLVCLIPICLGILITCQTLSTTTRSICNNTILLTILFIGLIYPIAKLATELPKHNGQYQQSVLHVMNELLQKNDDYVAGIELIYNKVQPIPGMRHLDGPAIDYLYYPAPKLRSVMLASLYRSPDVTIDSVIAALEQSNVKLYVNNYRIDALPPYIKSYLETQYQQFWGSIYLYAPLVTAGDHNIPIKFAGRYRVVSTKKIRIDDITIAPDAVIFLNRAEYSSHAESSYRLQFIPTMNAKLLNPEFQKDDWIRMLG